MNAQLANIVAIARREFGIRVHTRSFIFGTLLLVVGVIAIAFVPVIVRFLERGDTTDVAVYVAAPDLAADPVATLDALLDARVGSGEPAAEGDAFTVTRVTDADAARQDVLDGELDALLAIERAADEELAFTLYTEASSTGRTAQLVRQASSAIAIADRLERLGIAPADQASLFAPAEYAVASPDPDASGPAEGSAEMGASYLLGFGMTILIFMMIVLYGNWVAMSVVDEKSSRVMEVILNAATPFQLLTGKVLGVGAVAGVQYVALLVSGVAALLVQGPVADALLGGDGSVGLPEGLTVGMLLVFGVYGVLGFLLYAVLYAAAGSLVSRQEDVNSAVMPMSLLSTGGYIIAVYAATGLLDIQSGALAVLSQVPFLSPFMMLSRVAAGEIAPWELVLSIVLLVASVLVALWIAARIYAAGVLMYGQRPSVRRIWSLVRTGM